jgi:hypothetical protein
LLGFLSLADVLKRLQPSLAGFVQVGPNQEDGLCRPTARPDGLAGRLWQGRPVFLCFDSDASTNPSVRLAEWHLAETLRRYGAVVRVVRLPPGDPRPDGAPAKIGLDDFLVANGPDASRELLAGAVEPTAGKRTDTQRSRWRSAPPCRRLQRNILASVAQFETETRKERQSVGIAVKRFENDGKRPWGGRKAGTRITLTEEKEALARKFKKEGESVASIARNLGIARKTVYVALARS